MPGAVMSSLVASQFLTMRRPIVCSRCGVVFSHRSIVQGLRQQLVRLLTNGHPHSCEACTHRAMALREAQAAISMRLRL
jgi:hypothetical protein